MSQSLVNESGGARTPLSGAIAAVILLLVTLFLSHLLSALPQPVLAAVVLVAVAGLFKLSALKHLWRASRTEFVVAMAALLGVLGSGLLRGVLIGAVISLVQLIRRASRPHVASRAHPRHAAVLRPRAPSGQRVIPPGADLPPRIGPGLFQRGPCARYGDGAGPSQHSFAPAGDLRPVDLTPRGLARRPGAGRNLRPSSPPQASGCRSSRPWSFRARHVASAGTGGKSWAASAALVRSWMSSMIFRNRLQLKKMLREDTAKSNP